MMITPDDVRRLFAADADALLVLVEGRAEVVSAGALDSDDYRGALTVASRDELIDQVGSDTPSDHEIAEQAARLDATISNLGG